MSDEDDELFGAEHVRVFRETKGERGTRWRGTKILLLTTTGKSSGEPRTTPLIHENDGERWVVVASKGGAPANPQWFENLAAEPDIEIDLGPEQVPVHASVAEGEERERLWSLMTQSWPAYDDYQQKTEREIPVVVLARR
jgi:deazaflavin-dependent oxidoreductase (nitroreductase family)